MLNRLLIVGCLFWLLASCSAKKEISTTKDVQERVEAVVIDTLETPIELTEEQLISRSLLIDAGREKALGNESRAQQYYEQAIQLDEDNDAAHYELAKIFETANEIARSLHHAGLAATLKQNNVWYQTQYANLLANNNRLTEGIDILAGAANKNKKNIDIWFDLAQLYQQANRLTDAIAAYNHVESIVGIAPSTTFRKNRLYQNLGEIDKAALEVEKLIEHSPGDIRYVGYLAEFYEMNNELEKSIAAYDKLLMLDKDNASALIAKADLHMLLGNEDAFKGAIKDVIENETITLDDKVKVLYPLVDNMPKNEAFKDEYIYAAGQLVNEYPNDAKVYALYGDFLYNANELQGALNAYHESLKLRSDVYAVWEQVMFIYSGQRDFKNLAPNSAKAMALFPTEGLSFYMNGFSNYQMGNYDAAINALVKGVKVEGNNDRILAEMYSVLGDTYHNVDNHTASDLSYDKALLKNPNNVYVLNNYSYYLSLRNQNIDKAAAMIARAVELEPADPNILDTYAWVMFKKGDFTKALEGVEKAIDLDDERAIYMEHYGDILYKLGRKAEAVKNWERAKRLGRANELLDRKIAKEQYIEY